MHGLIDDTRRRSARGARLALGLALFALVAGACSTDATAGRGDAASPTPSASAEASPSPDAASATPSPSESPSPSEAEPVSAMPEIVRGIYSHAFTFWSPKWDRLVKLVEETELNAIVVDVKDEAGVLLWDIDHPLAEAGGGGKWRQTYDELDDKLQQLKDAGGWAIARSPSRKRRVRIPRCSR